VQEPSSVERVESQDDITFAPLRIFRAQPAPQSPLGSGRSVGRIWRVPVRYASGGYGAGTVLPIRPNPYPHSTRPPYVDYVAGMGRARCGYGAWRIYGPGRAVRGLPGHRPYPLWAFAYGRSGYAVRVVWGCAGTFGSLRLANTPRAMRVVCRLSGSTRANRSAWMLLTDQGAL
jgi:hypothetical protein